MENVHPLFEYMPGQTPYHYAFNNPVMFSDPSGLAPVDNDKGAKAKLQKSMQEILQTVNIVWWYEKVEEWSSPLDVNTKIVLRWALIPLDPLFFYDLMNGTDNRNTGTLEMPTKAGTGSGGSGYGRIGKGKGKGCTIPTVDDYPANPNAPSVRSVENYIKILGNPHELSDEDCQLVLNWLISIYETNGKEMIDQMVEDGKTVDITIKPGAEIADRYNEKAGTNYEFLGGCTFNGKEIEIAREAVDDPELLLQHDYCFAATITIDPLNPLLDNILVMAPILGDEILAHELRHQWQYTVGGDEFLGEFWWNPFGWNFISFDVKNRRERDARQFQFAYLFLRTGIKRQPDYWVKKSFWIYNH